MSSMINGSHSTYCCVFVSLASLLWAELVTRAQNIFIFQQYLCVFAFQLREPSI